MVITAAIVMLYGAGGALVAWLAKQDRNVIEMWGILAALGLVLWAATAPFNG